MSFNDSTALMLQELRGKKPLVHCITNYVTVNDCANALLAIGGSPVMADDIAEAADIATISNSLVINIGTLNERTIGSMFAAGKAAAKLGKPVILDPVGAGASRFRTDTALALMAEIPFAVIRGNISEIKTLHAGNGHTRGVDAGETDTVVKHDDACGSLPPAAREAIDVATALARRTGAVVAVTGAVDIVSDGTRSYAVYNGHPMMSRITGSGCMLSAVTGAFCGASPDRIHQAVAAALCAMGLAGEMASGRFRDGQEGTGSFRTGLIDALSLMTAESLAAGMKIELF